MESLTVREQLTREEAQAFASRSHGAIEWVRGNLEKAQKAMIIQANKHRREPDFTVDD